MRTRIACAIALAFAGFAAAQSPQPAAPAAKPAMPAVCTSCHQPVSGSIQGYFEKAAFKSGAIQLNLGTSTEIVRFDPKTIRVVDAGTAKPAEYLRTARNGHEARIEYSESGGVKSASLISFKGPIQIAPAKLIAYAEVEKLVSGAGAARFTLVDSRPLAKFQEGTIPGSVNLPYPAFDKFVGRLPADKGELLVFYCQGVTCMMSPNSLRRAEAMGYTNVKVYREGWPEWTTRNYGAITPAFVKEAFMAKDIPHVMIDVRGAAEARATGFIPGAVALPVGGVNAALASFPDPALKAPIMVYDAAGSGAAIAAAREIVAAGYPNVLVVTGGLEAWKSAGYTLATGEPAMYVAYAPKPRTGSIAAGEFRSIALQTPADTLVLDVRNRDEAKDGMIKGALLIPEDEILARLAEIPPGKRIVTHCSTGVRAEMAYHKLKEKGFQVAFLDAQLEIGKDGGLEVTPN